MKKYLLIAFSIFILTLVYLFQRVNYADVMNAILPNGCQITEPEAVFILNRTTRLIFNDTACMIFIFAAFEKKIYLRASFYLFLVELLIILPIYILIKLNTEGTSEISSPFLSQIHRLIVNPLLMLLLILGFVYQRLTAKP
jgi:exosortase F-associated protein